MFEDQGDEETGASLTLGELLGEKGEPQMVHASDTARTAGRAIARGRKAVSAYFFQLVNGQLLFICFEIAFFLLHVLCVGFPVFFFFFLSVSRILKTE